MTIAFRRRPRPSGQSLVRIVRRPLGFVAISYLLLITVVAAIAPLVLPEIAQQQAGDITASLQAPSSEHLLGTDSLGRDVLERLLVGSRVTLLAMLLGLGVGLALGVPFGLIAGYFGGWADKVVSWFADLMFSMPGIIIVLVVLATFPGSISAAMVTFGVLASPGLMRVVRSAALAVRQDAYIAAATVSGLSHAYIIARHVLPRITGPIVVQGSLLAAVALLVQTGLAFLGLLVRAPAPSWGGMVAEGLGVIVLQPWLIWPAGTAITLTVLALSLLADLVRDAATEKWAPPPSRSRRGKSARQARTRTTVANGPLLVVEGLRVAFGTPSGAKTVLDDVSFDLREGETVGLVGESGCGKTATAMSILGLLAGTGRIESGSVWFDGEDLTTLSEKALSRIRGRHIGLISQEPMVSLNPAFRVGWQLAEAVRRHHGIPIKEARERALDLLRSVRMPDPEGVARRYPHELSGGMAQRAAIARALAGEPRLLIADEPTTALDVTVQAEILDLLRQIQQERGMAILLVTHDWGVVADMCDRAIVMYAGQIVEQAEISRIFAEPRHPYTHALLEANPQKALEAEKLPEYLPAISGSVPQPGQWPRGCHFHPRCVYATSECQAAQVPLVSIDGEAERMTRCIHSDRLALKFERAEAT